MTDKIVPVALRLWLVFLLIFVALGYPVTHGIFFGAIAGLAGGMVKAWWNTPGGVPQARQTPAALKKIGGRLRPSGLQQRLPFLRLFMRRDRRYSRPRR